MTLLHDNHGAVFHQKGRSWVIHPDHAIVKGISTVGQRYPTRPVTTHHSTPTRQPPTTFGFTQPHTLRSADTRADASDFSSYMSFDLSTFVVSK